jgi:hypothetical protein
VDELGPHGPVPVGALDWTTWTGRTYRHTPDACEEAPLGDDERSVIGAARIRRFLDDHSIWADPDHPDHPDNREPDTVNGVHGVRARLHDIATALQPASPADDYNQDTVNRPETCTGLQSWHFSIDRDRRRHERQAQRRTPRTPTPEETDRRHISDLTEEPPF